MNARRAAAATLVIGGIICFTGAFNRSLWDADEPRVAEIGREMLASGDLVLPTLAGEPFLECPPFFYWLLAAAYRIFGVSDGAARATGCLAGLLTLVLVFDMARRLADRFAGVLAALALGTTALFINRALRCTVDGWLTFFVCLGYHSFLVAFLEREEVRTNAGGRRGGAVFLIYMSAGLAFLTKGLVGPGLIFGPIVLVTIATRRWGILRSRWHLAGVPVALALGALWPALLYARGGWDLLRPFVVDNLIYRVVPPADGSYVGGHVHPAWYYLTHGGPSLLPWAFAIPAAYLRIWRRDLPAAWNRAGLRLLSLIFPLGFLLLSVPATKRVVYLLPILPPLACVVGVWGSALARHTLREKGDLATQRALAAMILLVPSGIALGWIALGTLTVHPAWRETLDARLLPFLEPGFLGLATLAAFPLVGFGWSAIRSPAPIRVPILSFLFAFFVTAYQVLAYPRIDPSRSYERMVAEIARVRELPGSVIGFDLDESSRGAIPFETGRILDDVATLEALREAIARVPAPRVLMLEGRARATPKDILERLTLEKRWKLSRPRTYCLFAAGPPAVDLDGGGSPGPAHPAAAGLPSTCRVEPQR